MNKKVESFVVFVILFFCCLLFFKILVTQGVKLFDSYYSEKNYDNIELYLEKRINLMIYSTIISYILTGIFGVVLNRFLKPGYLIVIFAYIVSLVFCRLFYIDIFKWFILTDSGFLNRAILGILLLTIILLCVRRLMLHHNKN